MWCSVNGPVCLVYCVFAGGGVCWIDLVWSSKECACRAYDPSVHLSVPSIGFVYALYVGSYLLISEFENWITCICSPYVFSLCNFAYYVKDSRIQRTFIRQHKHVDKHLNK